VNFSTNVADIANILAHAAAGFALWRRAPMAPNLVLTSHEILLRIRQRTLMYL
jgi:hypothetical protein